MAEPQSTDFRGESPPFITAQRRSAAFEPIQAEPAELLGQLRSQRAGGVIALSCSKNIEEGARAALLLAPGLFRLDITPREDTLQIQVRNLSAGECGWTDGGQPLVALAFDGPAISAHTLRIDVDGRHANVLLTATRDPERGVMRFVAQAAISA